MVLIDGDVLVYSCGFAAQKTFYDVTYKRNLVKTFDKKSSADKFFNKFDDNLYCDIIIRVVPEPVENALHNIKEKIRSICLATGSEDYCLYLTGEGNFRETVATIKPYKGNRDKLHKPYWYKEIKEYIVNYHPVKIATGCEADDLMGVDCYNGEEGTIIATIDKDLDQVPGLHYNWNKPEYGVYNVTPIDGLRWFYKQLLLGDTVDNIQGVPGCGEKVVEIFDSFDDEDCFFTLALSAYLRYYKDKEEAVKAIRENGKLLWIWQAIGEEPPTEYYLPSPARVFMPSPEGLGNDNSL